MWLLVEKRDHDGNLHISGVALCDIEVGIEAEMIREKTGGVSPVSSTRLAIAE
jgi:hypothetical protein